MKDKIKELVIKDLLNEYPNIDLFWFDKIYLATAYHLHERNKERELICYVKNCHRRNF